IGRGEDPAKMIEQALSDMHEQLAKTKERVAAAIADEKKLKDELQREHKLAADWENRAVLALKEGREDMAKQALLRQSEHAQQAQTLHVAWKQHLTGTDGLKDGLRKLYDQVEELKRRKNVLLARATRAQAQRQIHDTMAGVGDKTAAATFERMEAKIADMERQTSAQAELADELKGNDLEQEFKALEQRGAADARLLELKQKLGLADGGARAKQLASTMGAVEDAIVVDEMHKRV
ncbi:MAG TPA: PspA/IM30 family protein, partial [Polyangiaceae bacterium]|nr:PspA/IM30 family protein [Polyangiaceae bacterium]